VIVEKQKYAISWVFEFRTASIRNYVTRPVPALPSIKLARNSQKLFYSYMYDHDGNESSS
jgi:hypothetical protein